MPAILRIACTVRALSMLVVAVPLTAQVGSDGPVRPSGGPLSERSDNVRGGSRPVHEPGRSTRSGGAGPLSGSSVRGSSVSGMRSGSVSDASRGAVRDQPPPPPMPFGVVPNPDSAEGSYIAPAGDLEALREQLQQIEPLPEAAEEVPLPLEAEPAELLEAEDAIPAPDGVGESEAVETSGEVFLEEEEATDATEETQKSEATPSP